MKRFVERELPLLASADAPALLDSMSWFVNLIGVALLFSPWL
jgi:hypothetical protein